MKIELNAAQRDLVHDILENRLADLRQEIRHSAVSKFTEQLKDTERLLKSTIRELKRTGPSPAEAVSR